MRKTDKKFVVYCHTNKTNNKKYIGITCQKLNQRFRNGNGYKTCPYFYRAIKKYGWNNFVHTVLYKNLSQEEAKSKEIELIKKYNTKNKKHGYNVTPGGEGCSGEDNPWYGHHHTEETRIKMSKQRKGVPKTEEWKRKIRESNMDRIVSDETKKKMRENHADVSGMNNPCFGRKLSKKHIEKMTAW